MLFRNRQESLGTLSGICPVLLLALWFLAHLCPGPRSVRKNCSWRFLWLLWIKRLGQCLGQCQRDLCPCSYCLSVSLWPVWLVVIIVLTIKKMELVLGANSQHSDFTLGDRKTWMRIKKVNRSLVSHRQIDCF